ncbi:FAD dependent oxidoreductase [Xylariaceae sp. FL0804]|nr:FAD dependent oxidoreductase [Xylariaceae sp. FL0804]
MPDIVVLGAGVSGLTCAYLLSQQPGNRITVVAKHMPGDYDIEYASPIAGANVLPMSSQENSSYERRGWKELRRLAVEVPEAGIHLQLSRVYRRKKDLAALRRGGYSFDGLFREDPWYASLFPDFRELEAAELPDEMASGCEFTSLCINVMLYLPWLVGQARKNGVVFRRGVVAHVADAASLSAHSSPSSSSSSGKHNKRGADVVVNATGLSARRLGGVADAAVAPIRGQVVVVRDEAPHMVTSSGTDDAADEVCYAMARAAGGGTVLGGTYQKGRWDADADPDTAARIMRRAADLLPEMLTKGKGKGEFDVVRHAVGLRPYREGGVRIEKERIDGVWVVHNYGHAGWGYQGSYGCAEDVVALVDEVLRQPKL